MQILLHNMSILYMIYFIYTAPVAEYFHNKKNIELKQHEVLWSVTNLMNFSGLFLWFPFVPPKHGGPSFSPSHLSQNPTKSCDCAGFKNTFADSLKGIDQLHAER